MLGKDHPPLMLPPEIWEQIASYLSKTELQLVRSLNSVFWKLALDVVYHQLVLYELFENQAYPKWLLDKKTRRLLHFQQPHVRQRVHTLRLDSIASFRYSKKPEDSEASVLSTALTAVHDRIFRPPTHNLPSIARRLITDLSNLKALHVVKPYQAQEKFLELAAIAWKHHLLTLGPNQMSVRQLHLDLYPGKGLQRVLQIPRSGDELHRYRRALMCLEYLCVRVIEACYGEENERNGLEELSLFSRFLRLFNVTYEMDSKPTSDETSTLVSNLTRLHLRICCNPKRQNPTSSMIVRPIFDALNPPTGSPSQPTLPNMTHCTLIITDTAVFPQAMEFITHHRHNITHLRTSPHRFFVTGSVDPVLPPSAAHSDSQTRHKPPPMTKLRHLEIASTSASDELLGESVMQTLRAYLIAAYAPSEEKGVRGVVVDPKFICSNDYLCLLLGHDDSQSPPSTGTTNVDSQTYSSEQSRHDWMPKFKASLTHLRHLSFTLFILTPRNLDLLLSSLPNLSSLHIRLYAEVWESPFRPSQPTKYETFCEFHCRPRLGVLYPTKDDEKKAISRAFLDELNNRARAQSHSNTSGKSRVGKSEGVDVRIGLRENQSVPMDVDVVETVQKSLTDAYPEIAGLVIGGDSELDYGVFEDSTW